MQVIRGCSVSGCERKHHGKGLCSHHYTRLYHKGDITTPIVSLPPKEKLLAKRNITGNGCWEWLGYRDTSGYGWIGINYRIESTHRIAYKIWAGEIPKGLYVLHKCDNPPCFNPEHLFLGSNRDNRVDAVKKNRHAKGEKIVFSKLTATQVLEARAMLGRLSQREIADHFLVDQSNISRIARRITWKHI